MKFNNIEKKKLTIQHKDKTEVYWHSRPLAVCIYFTILSDNGFFILANKRGDVLETEPLKWSLPGGYLDWNETITEAAKRELWEENGFYIDDYHLEYIYSNLNGPHIVDSNPERNGETLLVNIYISSLLPHLIELPKLSIEQSRGEAIEAKWLKMSDIEEMDDTEWAFNHKEKSIEYLQQLIVNSYIPI